MALELSPNDVNYLSTKLQTDNLSENKLSVTPVGNGSYPSVLNQYPFVCSTGNLIQYLQGHLNVTAAVASQETIGTFPSAVAPPRNAQVAVVLLSGGVHSTIPLLITAEGYIQPLVALANGDLVIFDGAFFISARYT